MAKRTVDVSVLWGEDAVEMVAACVAFVRAIADSDPLVDVSTLGRSRLMCKHCGRVTDEGDHWDSTWCAWSRARAIVEGEQ